MAKKISEVDGDGKSRLWLGGEAAVPRYPQRRSSPFVFNRSLLGLMALAVGLGFTGGLLAGLQCCRRSDSSPRG